MQLTYSDIVEMLSSDSSIKELIISEGSPVSVGYLRKLETPKLISEELVTEAIEREYLEDRGVLTRSHCTAILEAFQEAVNSNLTPNDDSLYVTYSGGDFRLMVLDKPLSDRLTIFYRRYSS